MRLVFFGCQKVSDFYGEKSEISGCSVIFIFISRFESW